MTTSPGSYVARDGVRKSWGSAANDPGRNCSVVFVVGRSKSDDEERNVLRESRKYGDILQVDVYDHYNNLTLKTVAILRYLITTRWKVLHTNK